LAAIRSFFRYVAMSEPAWLLHCQRIFAMPSKRYVKRAVTFLDANEIAALIAAPDQSTWAGRRDYAVLLVVLQTGLRASELVNLRCRDVMSGTGAHIRCIGKALLPCPYRKLTGARRSPACSRLNLNNTAGEGVPRHPQAEARCF
jgi:integrase/recombinase XerD